MSRRYMRYIDYVTKNGNKYRIKYFRRGRRTWEYDIKIEDQPGSSHPWLGLTFSEIKTDDPDHEMREILVNYSERNDAMRLLQKKDKKGRKDGKVMSQKKITFTEDWYEDIVHDLLGRREEFSDASMNKSLTKKERTINGWMSEILFYLLNALEDAEDDQNVDEFTEALGRVVEMFAAYGEA